MARSGLLLAVLALPAWAAAPAWAGAPPGPGQVDAPGDRQGDGAPTGVPSGDAAAAALVVQASLAERCQGGQGADDWLSRLPGHTRRILPAACSLSRAGTLYAWGEPDGRDPTRPWRLTVRSADGSPIADHDDLTAPRAVLGRHLAPGLYEWSVAYVDRQGERQASAWRAFGVVGAEARLRPDTVVPSDGLDLLPGGAELAAQVLHKPRPRLLPAGSSFQTIADAARARDFMPVLAALRASAQSALGRAVPAAPRSLEALAPYDRHAAGQAMRHAASAEREFIGILALVGQVDRQTAWLAAARSRLLALAAWPADGPSGEAGSNLTNREVYLGLAIGLDLLWHDLQPEERAAVVRAVRTRLLPAAAELQYLDRVPFDAHRVSISRWITLALMLVAGEPDFPEAQPMLAQHWALTRFTLGAWGDVDGSFGNGIAYAWYSFIQVVPYVAAVRVITGIDLYQVDFLRRAGEQLIAFTPPDHPQASAFGDETETLHLYRDNASSFFRLHAQMTRDPVDAWYWQVRGSAVARPAALQLIWQLLLLGADSRPLPAPVPPERHAWFFPDAGLAAVHLDAARSERTSLFFRASRFGAFNHAHADQNAFVYVLRGQPLLVGAGYYPYYGSPHHRAVTRATRSKNALTFDGGIGQAEPRWPVAGPGEPLHSMEPHGRLLQAGTRGPFAVMTGDAMPAYRAFDPATGRWEPLLRTALRSVVMDRSRNLVLVYDRARSDRPRRWELNLHAPKPFSEDGPTLQAESGGARVCIDRHGPAFDFSQTSAWEVPPEAPRPPQAHGRLAVREPGTELVSLLVLRGDCAEHPVRVRFSGQRVQVQLDRGEEIAFDGDQVSMP